MRKQKQIPRSARDDTSIKSERALMVQSSKV